MALVPFRKNASDTISTVRNNELIINPVNNQINSKRLLTVDEIHSIQKDQVRKWIKVYEKILLNCSLKIQQNVKQRKKFCFYHLPKCQLGIPLYDMKKCSLYLIKKLQEAKYCVSYVPPRTLFINWGKATKYNDLSVLKVNSDIINNVPRKETSYIEKNEKEIFLKETENDRKSSAKNYVLNNIEDKFLFS